MNAAPPANSLWDFYTVDAIDFAPKDLSVGRFIKLCKEEGVRAVWMSSLSTGGGPGWAELQVEGTCFDGPCVLRYRLYAERLTIEQRTGLMGIITRFVDMKKPQGRQHVARFANAIGASDKVAQKAR